jgi:hypothetical protein
MPNCIICELDGQPALLRSRGILASVPVTLPRLAA